MITGECYHIYITGNILKPGCISSTNRRGIAAKGVLARFQKPALASALVAMPASPIPPARASGEILKKGTAVVTMFIGSDCARAEDKKKQACIIKQAETNSFFSHHLYILIILAFSIKHVSYRLNKMG
jgi:hypothetical protein